MTTYGPIGRFGRYTATHFRVVAIAWALVAIALGTFAPRVETALSGAGWEATGSESVAARTVIDKNFAGLSSSALMVVVHSNDKTVSDPAFQRVITSTQRVLGADRRVEGVVRPQPKKSISPDRHTAIVQAGAAADANTMVRAADDLKGALDRLQGDGVQVSLTGASGMWSDFNEANRTAMMRSELFSWPVTLVILVLAFGSLVAAGLPLMLTILGLVASAGSLYLGTQLLDISIWAMNFALMFALALGIDYALFIVMRFRGALFGSRESVEDAVAETMDTAGKAVLFSGVTVLISLTAVMLVPSPAFRSMALGIMLSVIFILAATLTLLPAVLAKLGPRVDKLALPWVHSGEHRSPRFAAWGERLWKRPLAFGVLAVVVLLALGTPVLGLKTGMPSIKVVPTSDSSRVGYTQVQQAFGKGAPGALQITTTQRDAQQVAAIAKADAGIARVIPAVTGANGAAMVQAVPKADPSSKAVGKTVDRLRSSLPQSALVGGSVAENHDLEQLLSAKAPLVIGVVLALRLPAAARRAAGADHRRGRRPDQPAGHRRRLRRRPADLPGRPRQRPARLRAAGLPRRLGARVLLRDDLRDLDGLHRVPAVQRQGALGPQPRCQGGDDRRRRALRARRLRRRGRDGGGLLHLRPVRPAAAQGDGRHPRRRRPARRRAGPPAARAGAAAPAGPMGVVAAQAAGPRPPRRPVRARLMSMFRSGSKRNSITVVEALAGHQAGKLVLVDVREDRERSLGSIPGSRHLPLRQLKTRLNELPTDRSVAFICQSGRRSARATTAARRAGLDTYNVEGGMTAWERNGLDTNRLSA